MKRLNFRGFSVVELLVVISVTTILVIIISTFLITNLQQSTIATLKGTMLNEAQQSLDLAANDIRLSANADTNNRWPDVNGPSGAANPLSWESNGTTLVLATAAEDRNGTVIFSDAKNYITEKNNSIYFVKNGTLYKRTLASTATNNAAKTSCPAAKATASCPADKALLQNVKSFAVTYKDGDDAAVAPSDARSVELAVTVSKPMYQRDISVSYKTRMVFRND
ncbi:MAG: hypothetical protein U0524_02865 [Candidatus Saccharimonadales bacterium]